MHKNPLQPPLSDIGSWKCFLTYQSLSSDSVLFEVHLCMGVSLFSIIPVVHYYSFILLSIHSFSFSILDFLSGLRSAI